MADSAQPAIPGEYPPLHGGKLFFLTVAIAYDAKREDLRRDLKRLSQRPATAIERG